ncbi:hypothetical protein GRF59_00720 [Paenibacillus sp. HJL G12]|uniref:HEAT repeat domain-containing protein n=1 Tax=Paenibacillus dendrobii TaxID=2691084 RepID=A0A7X3LFF7_9BACL|nr:hypothetical protein [Paenibacillus dendrobii]MWV42140.1 hypothetical protein [Paenibacillus dendrobii]
MSRADESVRNMREWLGETKNHELLEKVLMQESNLPGPRANLGLAEAFADQFKSLPMPEEAWNLLNRWLAIDEVEAGDNDPKMFLPFCAIQALGACYSAVDLSRQKNIITCIREAMNDRRWRMREGAAMAMQHIGERDFNVLRSYIEETFEQATMMERRAFLAALAHPPLLGDEKSARFALVTSDRIMEDLSAERVPGTQEDYRVLSKGLEYAISLFVEKLPVEGFAMLEKYAAREDQRIRRIVKSNLGKARIAKKYPDQINRIAGMLS